MPSGSRYAAFAGTTACSAKPPRPADAITRSPGAKPLTSPPTSSTSPAISAPGMNGKGGFIWYCPFTIRMSKKLQPAARMRTRSMPRPRGGSGTSRMVSSEGSIQRSTTTARMAEALSRFGTLDARAGAGPAQADAGEEWDERLWEDRRSDRSSYYGGQDEGVGDRRWRTAARGRPSRRGTDEEPALRGRARRVGAPTWSGRARSGHRPLLFVLDGSRAPRGRRMGGEIGRASYR